MRGLPDYIDYNLKVIFVGYNPGEKSSQLQHHYAGRGNHFWKLLSDSGLTQRLYTSFEDSQLLKEGYGLTNLVSRPSKSSSDLNHKEMEEGAEELRAKILIYRPLIVCFLGKDVYRKYAGLKPAASIVWGLAEHGSMVPFVREFIAPNPSARSTVPYTERLCCFKNLRELVLNEIMNG